MVDSHLTPGQNCTNRQGNNAFRGEPLIVRDITADFKRWSHALKPGTLVMDPSFILLQSASAFQVMDPSMDPGVRSENSPDAGAETSFDHLANLTGEEVVGIMDQLLCYEAAWHMGYNLAQTLFISRHVQEVIQNPLDEDELGPAFLHFDVLQAAIWAYSVALIKACDIVINVVRTAQFYEDEDFSTNTWGLYTLQEVDVDFIVEGLLIPTIRRLKYCEMSSPVADALRARLQYRLCLLHALAWFTSKPPRTAQDLNSRLHGVECALVRVRRTHHVGIPVPTAFDANGLLRLLAGSTPPFPPVTVDFADAFRRLENLVTDCKDVLCILSPRWRGDLKITQNSLEFIRSIMSRRPPPLLLTRILLQLCFDIPKLLSTASNYLNTEVELQAFRDICAVVLPRHLSLGEHVDNLDAQTFMPRVALVWSDMYNILCHNRPRQMRLLSNRLYEWRRFCSAIEIYENRNACPGAGQPSTLTLPLTAAAALPGSRLYSRWIYHHTLSIMQWIMHLNFELGLYQPGADLAEMYYYLHTIAQHHCKLLADLRANLAALTTTGSTEIVNPSGSSNVNNTSSDKASPRNKAKQKTESERTRDKQTGPEQSDQHKAMEIRATRTWQESAWQRAQAECLLSRAVACLHGFLGHHELLYPSPPQIPLQSPSSPPSSPWSLHKPSPTMSSSIPPSHPPSHNSESASYGSAALRFQLRLAKLAPMHGPLAPPLPPYDQFVAAMHSDFHNFEPNAVFIDMEETLAAAGKCLELLQTLIQSDDVDVCSGSESNIADVSSDGNINSANTGKEGTEADTPDWLRTPRDWRLPDWGRLVMAKITLAHTFATLKEAYVARSVAGMNRDEGSARDRDCKTKVMKRRASFDGITVEAENYGMTRLTWLLVPLLRGRVAEWEKQNDEGEGTSTL